MNSGIYKITCLENGRFYIGSAKNFKKRWSRHLNDLRNNKHDNVHLQRAYNKYGRDGFSFEVVEECDIGDLLILEQFYLDELKPYEGGFNIGKSVSGGDNLTHHPRRNEVIENIKRAVLKRNENMSEDDRKLRWSRLGDKNYNYGNRWTIEMKENMSRLMKEKYKSGYVGFRKKGSTNADLYGKEIAEDISKKLSIIASKRIGDKNPFFGKSHTEESREKIRKKSIGRKATNRIKILIDDIIYESYHDASVILGIPVVTIRWRCLSKNVKFVNYKLV